MYVRAFGGVFSRLAFCAGAWGMWLWRSRDGHGARLVFDERKRQGFFTLDADSWRFASACANNWRIFVDHIRLAIGLYCLGGDQCRAGCVRLFFAAREPRAGSASRFKARPILLGFLEIVKDPRFYTYVVSGSVSFAGLFVYLAGSPIVFIDKFGVSQTEYGWIFATIAAGFIGMSQLNVQLLRRFDNQQLLNAGFAIQIVVGLIFLVGTVLEWYGLHATVLMFFCFMSCFGLTNPNSAALALAPFGSRAGRASAMLGFLQMGFGAFISSLVGIFDIQTTLPVVAIMAAGSIIGLLILVYGRTRIRIIEGSA